MRSNRLGSEHQEAVSRRLALLGAELAAVREAEEAAADPDEPWRAPPTHTRVRPDRLAPMAPGPVLEPEAPVEVPEPGRHARRRGWAPETPGAGGDRTGAARRRRARGRGRPGRHDGVAGAVRPARGPRPRRGPDHRLAPGERLAGDGPTRRGPQRRRRAGRRRGGQGPTAGHRRARGRQPGRGRPRGGRRGAPGGRPHRPQPRPDPGRRRADPGRRESRARGGRGRGGGAVGPRLRGRCWCR